MVRVFTTSVFVVAVLAVPALCTGGVITHACECAWATVCNHATDRSHAGGNPDGSVHPNRPHGAADTGDGCTDDGCGHATGCGHEGGCPDDPCSIHIVRPERQSIQLSDAQPAFACSIMPTAVAPRPTRTTRSYGRDWQGRKKLLPFPPSDLPLLI